VFGLLKCEVAECLWGEPVDIGHEAGVGVVLDVATVYEMLHPIEGIPLAALELYDVGLAEIDLSRYKTNAKHTHLITAEHSS